MGLAPVQKEGMKGCRRAREWLVYEVMRLKVANMQATVLVFYIAVHQCPEPWSFVPAYTCSSVHRLIIGELDVPWEIM